MQTKQMHHWLLTAWVLLSFYIYMYLFMYIWAGAYHVAQSCHCWSIKEQNLLISTRTHRPKTKQYKISLKRKNIFVYYKYYLTYQIVCKTLLDYPETCDCASLSDLLFLVWLWHWGWEQGGKRQVVRNIRQRQRKVNRETERIYNRQRERFRPACPLCPPLPPSMMCRCINTPFPSRASSAQQDPLCPHSLSCILLVQLLLIPPPPSPPFLHPLIRILGLVRASSPEGPEIQKADSIWRNKSMLRGQMLILIN